MKIKNKINELKLASSLNFVINNYVKNLYKSGLTDDEIGKVAIRIKDFFEQLNNDLKGCGGR